MSEYMPVDYTTIQPSRDGEGHWYVQHGTYGSGVLEGQPFAQKAEWFKTLEEAVAKYPDAEVVDHEIKAYPVVPTYEHVDEDFAGEIWADYDDITVWEIEEDYRHGGGIW